MINARGVGGLRLVSFAKKTLSDADNNQSNALDEAFLTTAYLQNLHYKNIFLKS
jgi:hypothetical protein